MSVRKRVRHCNSLIVPYISVLTLYLLQIHELVKLSVLQTAQQCLILKIGHHILHM